MTPDFTVEDGLPSNVINAIVQTRNGFLWVGTDDGLVRFDLLQLTLAPAAKNDRIFDVFEEGTAQGGSAQSQALPDASTTGSSKFRSIRVPGMLQSGSTTR